jgi:N-methylhydantoinase A
MTAPTRVVSARTVLLPLDALGSPELAAAYEELGADAARRLGPVESEAAEEVLVERFVAVRYVGQWHHLSIPFDADAAQLTSEFEDEHQRLYGTRLGDPLEIVECSVALTISEEFPDSIWRMSDGERGPVEELPPRYAFLADEVVPVYARSELVHEVAGPCVIEEAQSATWVPPGATARLLGSHLALALG